MEPNVCFEPSIDPNTLKHLVTDVPDPPKSGCEAIFLELAGNPQQQINSVRSGILKRLVTDVPDPPEYSGLFCDLLKYLCFVVETIWFSPVENFHLKISRFSEFRKTFFGSARFQDRHGTGPAAGEQSLHAELSNNNLNMENKSKILTQRSLKTPLPWDKKSIVLLCLSLFLPVTVCDNHMLSYYHTGLYYPEESRYYFEAVGYVDDQEIDMYTSESHVDIPKTAWIEKNEDDNYWEKQTSLRKGWEKVFRDNLMILASRFNYTKRSHTLQLSYGCELHNNEVGTGYYRYGFDGTDFLLFERSTLLWIPGMQKAEISAQRWNSDRAIGEGVKLYLTEHCTSSLKKYIGYGKEELEKKVRPEVKVWGRRQPDGATRLQCLVYGFHPRDVDVKWMKNGVDHVPSDEMTPILPHPDGTYQMRAGVEVPTTNEDTYSCHVEHSSLREETLIVKWDSESDRQIIMIITVIVVTGMVLSVASVIGFFKLKQKKNQKCTECFFMTMIRFCSKNKEEPRSVQKSGANEEYKTQKNLMKQFLSFLI